MTLSRKEFLKLSGVAVGAAVAPHLLPCRLAKAGGLPFQDVPANARAVLYDNTVCIGCRSCEGACKRVNGLPPDEAHPETLTAYTFTRIRTTKLESGPVYIKLQCMHCLHPACAEACIVGALEKTPDGPVAYDERKCIGCRYCQVACPFGIPNFEWDKPVPWIRKCTFCADRQAQGLEPACVEACPVHALKFGTREELLAEAKKRIADSPGRYVDRIYGEKEVGGTSWLYLSAVPFDKMGFAPHISEPVTINAARAMGLVPAVLIGVAATMTGIYWLTKRKEKLTGTKAGEEKKEGDGER